ncbi:conserved hypothetical protein [delta proteobacterium NaphS2]|nr:conserved hypothetical protein [delta proteobacterium NaphS2]
MKLQENKLKKMKEKKEIDPFVGRSRYAADNSSDFFLPD